MRTIRCMTIYILCCILLCILLLDTLLYWFDPLGLVAWHYTFRAQHEVMTIHPTGFAYPTGEHDFITYHATILEDGTRLVPDTNIQAACTIVFIGDSVTYGQGMNDSETWVNILAQAFPDVHFINTGRSAYSAANVLLAKQHYQGDGYIWTLIKNDANPPFNHDGSRPTTYQPPASRLYFDWFFRDLVPDVESVPMERYWQTVEQIITDNTLVIGIADEPLAEATADRYPVHLIPLWTTNISAVDIHADTRGNIEIAEHVMPFVEPFISRICRDE